MANPIGHLKTINKHRHAVIKNCFRAGIPLQGLRHDLSKYAPVEFLNGAKYYDGSRSPNELERNDKGYSEAWLHHKGRNKHHFEYWTDYNLARKCVMPIKMPLKYVIEMFCDRVAASKTYMKDKYTTRIRSSILRGARVREALTPKPRLCLKSCLLCCVTRARKKPFAI